jgi:hypothetical protein
VPGRRLRLRLTHKQGAWQALWCNGQAGYLQRSRQNRACDADMIAKQQASAVECLSV